MGLNALDILVLLLLGGCAIGGLMRGFTAELISLATWAAVVVVVKLFHAPLAHALTGVVTTVTGSAVLALAILAGATYLVGGVASNTIGKSVRRSVLAPIDRVLGLGLGLVKGLILASLGFLVVVMATDTMGGGPLNRPLWLTDARTYPLLNATSSWIADMVNRRRHGLPVFGVDAAGRPRAPKSATDGAN